MPNYRVWYRDIPAPLEFVAITRCTEAEIVERILAQEQIDAPPAPTVGELIANYKLAPVRYTEDESEINVIK